MSCGVNGLKGLPPELTSYDAYCQQGASKILYLKLDCPFELLQSEPMQVDAPRSTHA